MIERLRHALRRETMPAATPPPRPNQLSQEAARAERLRREALRKGQSRRLSERSTDDLPERREPIAAAPPPERVTEPWPVQALASRATLRQAWQLMEILGPPRALRNRDEDQAIGRL